ncbi:glycosyltransferase family 2 protein [Rhizorhabdus argentea]|uniref:glycosyltransferase family 2 protein n=1 Tax=Rhizorhabdus argentea TaxID=1387174 RepID=UPI0030EF7069
MSRSDIAAVVIGRNEGARLDSCLRSLQGFRTVYVDSGSSDSSADLARAAGAEVIELDAAGGFSPARGRNAGLMRVTADPAIHYIQMVDGDCVLDPGWIATGAAALDTDSALGAVFGRLREIDPEASIYSWLCDVEWAVPTGSAAVFAGLVMLRAEAVRDSGGYRSGMIAGEEPELAIRLRAAGWRILSLAQPMAVHDAGITRFGQWWRRTVRAGHAFAELVYLHPGGGAHDFVRSRRRILLWGGIVPCGALAGLLAGMMLDPRWTALVAAAILLILAQAARATMRDRLRYGGRRAFMLALFLAIGKYAEMIGLIRFHLDRRFGPRPRSIEQKAP